MKGIFSLNTNVDQTGNTRTTSESAKGGRIQKEDPGDVYQKKPKRPSSAGSKGKPTGLSKVARLKHAIAISKSDEDENLFTKLSRSVHFILFPFLKIKQLSHTERIYCMLFRMRKRE
jgi:hypothetical protein